MEYIHIHTYIHTLSMGSTPDKQGKTRIRRGTSRTRAHRIILHIAHTCVFCGVCDKHIVVIIASSSNTHTHTQEIRARIFDLYIASRVLSFSLRWCLIADAEHTNNLTPFSVMSILCTHTHTVYTRFGVCVCVFVLIYKTFDACADSL